MFTPISKSDLILTACCANWKVVLPKVQSMVKMVLNLTLSEKSVEQMITRNSVSGLCTLQMWHPCDHYGGDWMRQDQAGQVHVSAPVPYWGGCTKHGSYEGISSTIIIIIIRFIKFVWESLVFKPNSVHSLATFMLRYYHEYFWTWY